MRSLLTPLILAALLLPSSNGLGAKPSPSPQKKKPSAPPKATPEASVEATSKSKAGAQKRPRDVFPNASLSPAELADFSKNPPTIRKLIEEALALTRRDLTYTFGSADPEKGGMDCSGFIYYILLKQGIKEVPRDSGGQYAWVRKGNRFQAVAGNTLASFEFEKLRAGDLLFWTGTYNARRDPPISHVMIYLGKEKATGKPVMVGSSDGRTYQGKRRWGVSVFDFQLPKPKGSSRFIGYAPIPKLSGDPAAD